MITGTSSHSGKSVIVAGLCRILSKRGYNVAPFKAQNMSLNSYVTEKGKEIAISQAFQAFAAGITPDERMNPVLLKPKGDGVSQLVLMGEAVGDISITEYYRKIGDIMSTVESAFRSLESEYDVIVIEGAGGMAEINLYEKDIANIKTAKMVKPDIFIVGDIDRGGVFSSLFGTYSLLPDDVKPLVRGFIINKFRGLKELLIPGMRELEKLTDLPVAGVLPYIGEKMFSEDSLDIDEWAGMSNVGILRLPRISNFTDFEKIRAVSRFVELKENLDEYDVIIIPGTKDTVGDLKALKESGMAEKIRKIAGKKPVIGVCGGYQILGKEIIDMGVEHGFLRVNGLGLLDCVTEFREFKKKTVQVKKRVTGDAVIVDRIKGEFVWGYEIHKGITESSRPVFEDDGCMSEDGMVWGSYLHGLFWNENVIRALERYLGISIACPEDGIEKLSAIMEENLDLGLIFSGLY
jgi:adenosylcobyric acid synthase